MIRCWMGLALWLLPPIVVWSEEFSPPPTQQVLRIDDSGQWQLQVQVAVCKVEARTRTVTKRVPETKTVTETVDGEPVRKTVTEYKDVAETQQFYVCVTDYQPLTRSVSESTLKAFEMDGRAIPMDQLRSRIGAESLVVVSATGVKLSAAYSTLFKPGTIVVAFEQRPSLQTNAAPATVPQPAPVAVPTTPAVAAPRSHLPHAPAPQFLMLGRGGVDEVVVRRASELVSPVTGMAVFKKGNVKEQAPVQMMQTLRQSESFMLAAKHLRFHLGDSQVVPMERIKERMAREIAVVYSADGEAVDPFWLQNLKSTTLVVTGPQLPSTSSSCGPAAPAMMSAPIAVPAPGPTPVTPAPAITPMPPSSQTPQQTPPLSAREPMNPARQTSIERDLSDRANAERKHAHLAPLTLDRLMNLAANSHAAGMAEHEALSHHLDGQSVGDRLSHLGVSWIMCGENIARGQEAPAEVMESWMNSPGHRANLLEAKYTHIGVACRATADGQKYWTMVLAQAR